MTKILLIDDIQDNIDVLELLIEQYMLEHGINDYIIQSSLEAEKGLEILKNENIDIVFLDIMMPQTDGFEFLQIARNDPIIHQPIIVMATALGDDITKQKEQKYGANAFMVKPIIYKTVKIMLDRYLKILKEKSFKVEDEFDFDFDFDDEIEDDESYESDSLINIINKQEFMQAYDAQSFYESYEWNIENVEKRIEDLDYVIFRVFDSLDEDLEKVDFDLEEDFKNILEIITEYAEFVSMFEELSDMQIILLNLKSSLNQANIFQMSDINKNYLAKLIKAVVSDLIDFKDKVFLDKSVANIHYLDASIAFSCSEIQKLINKF